MNSKKKVNYKLIGYIFIILISLNLINAIPNDRDVGLTFNYLDTPTNYSTINVNNSDFLDGYDSSYFASSTDLSSYVPYSGATGDVNLGSNSLKINGVSDWVSTRYILAESDLGYEGIGISPLAVTESGGVFSYGGRAIFDFYRVDGSIEGEIETTKIAFYPASSFYSGDIDIGTSASRFDNGYFKALDVTNKIKGGSLEIDDVDIDGKAVTLDNAMVFQGSAILSTLTSYYPFTFYGEDELIFDNEFYIEDMNFITYEDFVFISTGGGGLDVSGSLSKFDHDVWLTGDNDELILGAGKDTRIFWDGSDTIINSTVGNVLFKNNSGWGEIEYGNAIDHTANETTENPLENFKEGAGSSYEPCKVIRNYTDYSRPVSNYITTYGLNFTINNKSKEGYFENYSKFEYYKNELDKKGIDYEILEKDVEVISYPYKIELVGTDATCRSADVVGALADINKVITIEDNITDFDTDIMAENIWTQSKTMDKTTEYKQYFLDENKLSSKLDHYAYEENIKDTGKSGLSVEDRIVALEGMVNEMAKTLCELGKSEYCKSSIKE